MKNPRVTQKEKGLIKGALRRVFSRSDLRKAVLQASIAMYSDALRARVKKWSRCNSCKELHPTYLCEVDHISPVIKFDEKSIELDANTLIDRIWCEEHNLQVLCESCHDEKTAIETRARKAHRDANKPHKVKKPTRKK